MDRYADPATSDLLWLLLRQLTHVATSGRALFPKPLANQNRLWREFCNYSRQAEAYWTAATRTEGSSSALLYYYAFLNLAKGELLTSSPSAVYGARIHHGLSYSPTSAQSIRGDILKVVQGVFPMLYEKRTGTPLQVGTTLRVSSLLSQVPEIGLELTMAGFGPPRTLVVFQALVSDGSAAWPLLCFIDNSLLDDTKEPATKALRRHFDEVAVDSMGDWRDTFAITRRLSTWGPKLFQSKRTFTQSSGEPDFAEAAYFLRDELGPYIDDALQHRAEALFSFSLTKSRPQPMPPSLARYALKFYVSSLVRYKPSQLDPVRQGSQAWLLDSFTKGSPLPLLASTFGGITNRNLTFESSGFRV